eukprot:SAG25_NODE_16_length_24288_cov_31.926950_21_plen_97_part_00
MRRTVNTAACAVCILDVAHSMAGASEQELRPISELIASASSADHAAELVERRTREYAAGEATFNRCVALFNRKPKKGVALAAEVNAARRQREACVF